MDLGLIRDVFVGGFRSAHDVSIAPGPVCALVGEAQTGKSNLLAAIRAVLDPSVELRPDDTPRNGDGSLLVRARLCTGARLELSGTPASAVRRSQGTAPPVLLAEAILLDHHNSARNTADGLHLAALAGGWSAVVNGLAGTREHDSRLSFAPRLPDWIERIAFPYAFRRRRLRVEITRTSVAYTLQSGAPLGIDHWGAAVELQPGEPTNAPIPEPGPVPVLRQPHGRAPQRRRPASDLDKPAH